VGSDSTAAGCCGRIAVSVPSTAELSVAGAGSSGLAAYKSEIEPKASIKLTATTRVARITKITFHSPVRDGACR